MFKRNDDFNIILATDGYKFSHWKQYPPGTEHVFSYFESRGGKFDETVFFGLQYLLKRYLEGVVVTQDKIDEAEPKIEKYFGTKGMFNREGWEYILKAHGGKLPVRIKAVPEGMHVPTHNVLMTIENTDSSNCGWLTNYLETMLVQVWYPTTVCTLSNSIRKTILEFLKKTGTPEGIDFKLHDFGYRGAPVQEAAGLGAAAHLVNFLGSDTFAGIELLSEYYDTPSAGFSIPASEHSTITSWGRENESRAMLNMLEQYPTGLVACVSDSYDIFNACSNIWGKELKAQVLARDGVLVVRPDSGIPVDIVHEVIRRLGEAFGYSVSDASHGYRVLHPKVRVIQGDGVDDVSIRHILVNLEENGWSADNIAFGCGGALLQKLDRDTQKFAFKCSSVTINGEERDVFKEPITDSGKNSKRGRLSLISDNGRLKTIRQENLDSNEDILKTVFLNGDVTSNQTLASIRKRAIG